MSQRIALFLDANQLTAYGWSSGRLSAEGRFAADGHGLEAFAQYLVRQRHSLFYLLAEVFDEAFRLDDIPCVRGNDRCALLARKLDQIFHDTPLNLALSLGREGTGRRDEKMLFAGLTRPQQFEPWLASLREQEGRLAGIYSIPLLAGALAADLAANSGVGSGPMLLVTLTSGGLRQSFFNDGSLRFSRLTPLPSASMEQSAGACAREAESTYHYLVGQRQISRGTPLTTLVLAHPEEISVFRNHCRDSEDVRFGFIDLLREAEKSGLKSIPGNSQSEALFLHLMVKHRPHVQFAHDKERRFFQLWQIGSALKSGGALILLGCLLFSGMQSLEGYRLDGETRLVRFQSEGNRQRYATIMAAQPPLPASIDRLSTLISRYDDLEKRSASLEPMFRRISHALQGSPGIQINRIEWRIDAGPAVISDVYAQLPSDLGHDKRAHLTAIQAFKADLGKDVATETHILKMPFDTAPEKSLKGSHDIAASDDTTSFSLRLLEKP